MLLIVVHPLIAASSGDKLQAFSFFVMKKTHIILCLAFIKERDIENLNGTLITKLVAFSLLTKSLKNTFKRL